MSTEPRIDELATHVRERARARGAFVIVIDGRDGNGFAGAFTHPELAKTIPDLLRTIATWIEASDEA